jgi:hypothetical protein
MPLPLDSIPDNITLHRFDFFTGAVGNYIIEPTIKENREFEIVIVNGVKKVNPQNHDGIGKCFSLFEFDENIKHLYSRSDIQYSYNVTKTNICFNLKRSLKLDYGIKLLNDEDKELKWWPKCTTPIHSFDNKLKVKGVQKVKHWALYPDIMMDIDKFKERVKKSFKDATLCAKVHAAGEKNDIIWKKYKDIAVKNDIINPILSMETISQITISNLTNKFDLSFNFENREILFQNSDINLQQEDIYDTIDIIKFTDTGSFRDILFDILLLYPKTEVHPNDLFKSELLLCWLYQHSFEELLDVPFFAKISYTVMTNVFDYIQDYRFEVKLNQMITKFKGMFHWTKNEDSSYVIYKSPYFDSNFQYVISFPFEDYDGYIDNVMVDPIMKKLEKVFDVYPITALGFISKDGLVRGHICATFDINFTKKKSPIYIDFLQNKEIEITIQILEKKFNADITEIVEKYPNEKPFFAAQKFFLEIIKGYGKSQKMIETISEEFSFQIQDFYCQFENTSFMEFSIFEEEICFLSISF